MKKKDVLLYLKVYIFLQIKIGYVFDQYNNNNNKGNKTSQTTFASDLKTFQLDTIFACLSATVQIIMLCITVNKKFLKKELHRMTVLCISHRISDLQLAFIHVLREQIILFPDLGKLTLFKLYSLILQNLGKFTSCKSV